MTVSSNLSANRTINTPSPDIKNNGTKGTFVKKPRLPNVKPVTSDKFMVVTQHKLASEAGAKMLQKGGTATDAMIAALAVLNAVTPEATGIGGGGFLLGYNKKSDKVYTLDGRETAPASAKSDMFIQANGEPKDPYKATIGGQAVATPGLLKMLKQAHDENGKLPWAELFQPAIRAAENGFPMPERLRNMIINCKNYSRLSNFGERYLNEDGSVKAKGEMIKNPELAATFKVIATEGIEPFYTGEIAKDIINTVSGSAVAPAVLGLKDLADYKVIKREPVSATYHDDTYYTAESPCTGGVAVLEALKLLERFNLKDRNPNDLKTDHLIFNAMRMAYADRNAYLGDPDFTKNLTKSLLDKDYIQKRSEELTDEKPIKQIKPGVIKEKNASDNQTSDKPCTSHISIVDAEGNAVSMTSSVEYLMGSGLETKGGFILNNSMTDFDFTPADPGQRNGIAPKKRPRSAMAPMISFNKDGKLKSVIGSPGGGHIIGYMLPRLIAMQDLGVKPEIAITTANVVAPNPEPILLMENQFANSEKAEEYRKNGYEVKPSTRVSGVNVIESYNGLLTGVSDPRREGGAVGG